MLADFGFQIDGHLETDGNTGHMTILRISYGTVITKAYALLRLLKQGWTNLNIATMEGHSGEIH
jgi:hypothetical protein